MAEKESERLYTIPLRGEAMKSPRVKRANRAVKTIQSFLQRHMKSDTVKVSQKLNETVWVRGIHHPPSKIKLKARKEGGIVYAMLPDETFEVKKKEQPKEEAKTALQKKAEELSEKLKREKQAKAAKPAETGEQAKEAKETKKEEPRKEDEKKETKKKK